MNAFGVKLITGKLEKWLRALLGIFLTQVSSPLVLSARAPEQRMARRSQLLGQIYLSFLADQCGLAAAEFLRQPVHQAGQGRQRPSHVPTHA